MKSKNKDSVLITAIEVVSAANPKIGKEIKTIFYTYLESRRDGELPEDVSDDYLITELSKNETFINCLIMVALTEYKNKNEK